MKNYKMNNGQIISAKNELDFVTQLNNLSWFNHRESVVEYMKSTAKLCESQKVCHIRYDSIKNFVDDLHEFGFINEIINVDN